MAWAHRQNLTMYPSLENTLETYMIWDEVGFKPPISLMLGIEMLHHIGMTEDARDESITSLAHEMLMRLNETNRPQERYIITDQADMIRTAIDYGIPVAGRRPEEIAQAITEEVIADYLPYRKSPEY